MVSVVKYFRRNHLKKKMIFLKIFSNVWLSQKKLRKAKMQLSYESGNVRSPLPDSGEHVPVNSGRTNGRILTDRAEFRPFWLDPAGF
jgi:hypothetical protein